jgi:cytochrome c oxidase subunit 2
VRVDLYERFWLWCSAALIAAFLAAIGLSAALQAVHPPSHVETIDPTRVRTDTEFADPRVERRDDGSMLVVAVAELYQFRPGTIRVPAGVPVTFRITSPDVIHGFQIVGTNVNVMVAPGYVSQLTVTFDTPGEYLALCNEYCGLSHHLMQSRLVVEERAP